MDAEPARGLQALILRRLAEMGDPSAPMGLRPLVERSGGVLDFDRLRAVARGERSGTLTAREAEALATVLDVPLEDVAAAATVLRQV